MMVLIVGTFWFINLLKVGIRYSNLDIVFKEVIDICLLEKNTLFFLNYTTIFKKSIKK